MTWMLTASGRQVDLRFMPEAQLDLADIAHHLAQLNRFTGACMRPYSVAEHSLLVVEIMERDLRVSFAGALLAGLLHDAHEAYTSDLSSPMKRLIGSAWHEEEKRVQAAVLRRFQCHTAFVGHWSQIHQADCMAAATEHRDLLPASAPPLDGIGGARASDSLSLKDRPEQPWHYWREAFLARVAELQAKWAECANNAKQGAGQA